MSALAIAAIVIGLLSAGACLGSLVMAMVAAGHHEDECRRCAVRDVGSYGGTDS